MCALLINNTHADNGEYRQIFKPEKLKMAKTCISSELKPTLEKFILSSNSPTDRIKALEMLSSIDECKKDYERSNYILKEYKLKKNLQRPKTALARFNDRSNLQRFSTTYNEYYPPRDLKETTATRPWSTQNIIIRPNNSEESAEDFKDNIEISEAYSEDNPQQILSVYNQKTTYNKDFCSVQNSDKTKFNLKHNISPIRAGTASGSRCHNPHPNQAFLVWRYPREINNKTSKIPSETLLKANMEDKFAHITDEEFDRVMRGNCRSTYQSDFVGGIYPESRVTPLYIHPMIKTGEKLKISTQRIDYNSPDSLPGELTVPHERYKSNKTKHQSAQGIIPEATNKIYMKTRTRTTYDEDINDRAEIIHGEVVGDIQRKVDLRRVHNMKSLEKAMLGAKNNEDKETLARIFEHMNEPDSFKRKSFVRKPFYNSDGPCWTSNWPGPL